MFVSFNHVIQSLGREPIREFLRKMLCIISAYHDTKIVLEFYLSIFVSLLFKFVKNVLEYVFKFYSKVNLR